MNGLCAFLLSLVVVFDRFVLLFHAVSRSLSISLVWVFPSPQWRVHVAIVGRSCWVSRWGLPFANPSRNERAAGRRVLAALVTFHEAVIGCALLGSPFGSLAPAG